MNASNTHSWVYGYDPLSRLRSAERGILNSTKDGIDYSASAIPRRVLWGLDTRGN
ncbi:MAG TPA: hypothetical protein VFF69_14295 [Phycisphaerales bacterium]|nr:hypothetical protein [Phycisphaerales bacterium]